MRALRPWLIWLAVVLLPFSGWAWAGMTVSAPSSVSATHSHACHEESSTTVNDSQQHPATCAHCPWCHACASESELPEVVAPHIVQAAPDHPLRLADGRLRPCELFRPPQA